MPPAPPLPAPPGLGRQNEPLCFNPPPSRIPGFGGAAAAPTRTPLPTPPGQPLLRRQSPSPGLQLCKSLLANHPRTLCRRKSSSWGAGPLPAEAKRRFGAGQKVKSQLGLATGTPGHPDGTGMAEAESEEHKETVTVPIFAASIFRLKSQFRGSLRDMVDQEGPFAVVVPPGRAC